MKAPQKDNIRCKGPTEEQHVSQTMEGCMKELMRESREPHEQGKKDTPLEGPASAQREQGFILLLLA